MSKVVTIVGQGYVGLPLAQEAVRAGWKVYGLDASELVVAKLNAGESHVDDLSDDDVNEMIENGYVATKDPSCIRESDVSVICVPTPLGVAGAPDLGAVESATRSVGENLKQGSLVVLESTTYPGTTEDVCIPILEAMSGKLAGRDFYVSFSPERVNPGFPEYGIKNTPKLVGGLNETSTEKTVEFYSTFVDEVVPLSGVKEAETAKLLENTFRHVNIALVNEMARVCHELGIDIWEVIRGAATKPFGFMRFTPGAGVGGHCIPIDPNYLSYEVRRRLGYPLRFVELAQEINNTMPEYVVDRGAERLNSEQKAISSSTVLLLGVTYKPNIADQRESPSRPVATGLLKRGANVIFHDPFVSNWDLENGDKLDRVDNIDEALQKADLVVMLQAHSSYDVPALEANAKAFLDTTGRSLEAANRI